MFGISGDFSQRLPLESRESRFDTVGATQHFSAAHLDAYLKTADRIIETALRLDANPYRSYEFDLANSKHLNSFHERDLRIGGDISLRRDQGVVIFRDVDYLVRSDQTGFLVRSNGSGTYRVTAVAKSVRTEAPVAMKLVTKDVSGESELIAAIDLVPGEEHVFEVDVWLNRNRVFYVSMDEERLPVEILGDILVAGGPEEYEGAGIHIRSLYVEGPLSDSWPPNSTRQILGEDIELSEDEETKRFDINLSKSSEAHVADVITRLLPRMFRRPASNEEIQSFVDLAKSGNDDLTDRLHGPLRAMLTAPQFLLLSGPPGPLDDYALASRLSYFLWKTFPDKRLIEAAEKGKLSDSSQLAAEVDRMLNDKRSQRFISDFINQWLRLDKLDETTPDEKLYPEYDRLLHWSLKQETGFFLKELIDNNLSTDNLIDSDFVMLNRRLAEHYGIDGVVGQNFRRVELPADSVRGGLLTQASVLKVTANGLTTSPVKRGEFVLSELLGTPPPPAPPNVGSIEPDTSGATTIRETLAKHRDVESCAECHRQIDPPGFALESFDPTGAFRSHYRNSYDEVLSIVKYQQGAEVDASGVTASGKEFSDIRDFRDQLMQHRDRVAKHFIELLIVYATGGEIGFSDRDEVEAIFQRMRKDDFPVRSIIHEVVRSRMFRYR